MTKRIRITPYTSDGIGNEHWIQVFGDELQEDDGQMSYQIEEKLLGIFQRIDEDHPEGSPRGNRIELYRRPTEQELEKLKVLANEVGAQLELDILSEEKYREIRSGNKGPFGPVK